MYDRGAGFNSTAALWQGSRRRERGNRRRILYRQVGEFWDAVEYAAYCHLCGALSEVLTNLEVMCAFLYSWKVPMAFLHHGSGNFRYL